MHLKGTAFQTRPRGESLYAVSEAGKDMAVALKHPCAGRLMCPLNLESSQPVVSLRSTAAFMPPASDPPLPFLG